MMTRWIHCAGILFLSCSYSLVANPGLTPLHSFGSTNIAAAYPYARVIQASDGWLYGTTAAGGNAGQGTLFRLNPEGSGFAVLKNFGDPIGDGSRPFSAVIEGSDGALYGTTSGGGQAGAGTIYKIGKDGNEFALLKSFSGDDGASPEAALIEGSDGLLYGTVSGGGTNDNGAVFRLGKDGTAFTTLFQFAGTNGANPESELMEASDGLLYGTTAASNTNSVLGTVFRLQKDGTAFTLLARFQRTSIIRTNGVGPLSRLVEGTNGMLYGTTGWGGTKSMGTIYRLNKDGTGLVMLFHFGTNTVADGRSPLGELTLGSDGMLYGTTFDGGTNGSGTIFRIAQDGTGYTVIHSLVTPRGPAAGLVEGTNGALYGTSQFGGVSGEGTVFSLQKDGSDFAVLKNLSASGEDGRFPSSPPIAYGSNQLFGTTRLGGASAAGTVYSIRFDGVGYDQLSDLEPVGGPADLFASLTALTNGQLIGASRYGGAINAGTLFSVDQAGLANVLFSPSSSSLGQEFRGALIQGTDGLLYGTSMTGGASGGGTVFRVNTDGSGYVVLQNFAPRSASTGANPVEPVLEASDGNLYGTGAFGGITNRGVLFKISKDGTGFTILKTFGSPAGDGETPMSPLLEASDGRLYGTTYGGGSTNNGGTLFGVNKDGSGFQVLVTFASVSTEPRHPSGALFELDGGLYGTTERGGASDEGALYRVGKDGSGFMVLASLGGRLGARPGGLVQGPDGALYLATSQGGEMGFGELLRYGPAFGDIVALQLVGQVPTVTAIGRPGVSYELERSLQLGPLAAWAPVLSTNAPDNGRFSVPDPGPGTSQSFYRLKY